MIDTTIARTSRQYNDTAPHASPVTPKEDARSVMISSVSRSAIFAGAVGAIDPTVTRTRRIG